MKNNIEDSTIQFISAHNLLVPTRLDIGFRFPLIRAVLSDSSPEWGIKIYFEYLNKCRLGGNYSEDDKHSFSDYLESFLSLISSMANNGYSRNSPPLKLYNGSPVDGAHRIAVAALLKQLVPVVEFDEYEEVQDYDFLKKVGIGTPFLESAIQEFVRYQSKSRAFILLNPTKDDIDSVTKYLNNNSFFLVAKHVSLSEIGKRRIIDIMYSHNSWWNSSLMESFVSERFTPSEVSSAAIFLYLAEEKYSNIRDLKLDIRTRFFRDSFERRFHGSDEHFDTVTLVEVFFNQNSLHFLNNSPFGSEKRIVNLISNISERFDSDNFCLTGSTTLEFYGIREARDLDVALLSSPKISAPARDTHLTNYGDYSINEETLILDPRYHITYKGLKFASLSAISSIKNDRREDKDIEDLHLIEEFKYLNQKTYHSWTFKMKSLEESRKRRIIELRTTFLSLFPNAFKKKIKTLITHLSKNPTKEH